MPKKSRQSKAKHRAKKATAIQRTPPQTKPVSTGLHTAAMMPSQIKDSQYQYLGPELRRISILAGSIIVTLIILSFILG